jgi:hypothetical protein
MIRMLKRLRVIVLATALAVVACGSPTSPQPRTVGIGEAQNGQSVGAHVGDTLRLRLSRTTWTISGSSDPSVLQALGEQVVSPAPPGSCYPGMGCGTTTALFRALRSGSATVTATRVSCGEALRCVGAEGQYEVVVVVS